MMMIAEEVTDDGWTPRLSADGVFYCSPRCGGGQFCHRDWYDTAVAKADALAARMGPGWEPRVWENLGWHYEVRKGVARITPVPLDHGYSAWIEPNVSVEGYSVQFIETAETPEDALGFATQAARTAISRIEEALAQIISEDGRG